MTARVVRFPQRRRVRHYCPVCQSKTYHILDGDFGGFGQLICIHCDWEGASTFDEPDELAIANRRLSAPDLTANEAYLLLCVERSSHPLCLEDHRQILVGELLAEKGYVRMIREDGEKYFLPAS